MSIIPEESTPSSSTIDPNVVADGHGEMDDPRKEATNG